MNGAEVYRIYTYHRTQMLMDADGKLIHRAFENVGRAHLPVYARQLENGIAFFVIKENKIMYLMISTTGVGLTTSPTRIEFFRNDDGSLSIVCDKKFLSARRENGSFDFRVRNSDWERYTFDRAEFELTEEYFPPMMLGENERSIKRTPSKEISPKVSVIIPMFNTEKYIGECLESLLEQTMPDFEAIVVDDYSTDRSTEIVENYIDRFDGRLILIRLEKNSGNPGTPRNIGLNIAVGKYLFFMDSDDRLKNDALEKLYNVAEEYHADAVESVTNYYLRKGDGDEFRLSQYSRRIARLTFEQYDIERRIRDCIDEKFEVVPWTKFVRRQCLAERRAIFPPTYAADDAGFTFQCALSAKIYLLIPEPYYYYRIMSGTISRRKFSLDEQLARHIKTVNVVIQVIDSFLSGFKSFDRHPTAKYMSFKRFFQYCIGRVRYASEPYKENASAELYPVIYNIFADGVNFTDELIALCLTFANEQLAQLSSRDRQIEELKIRLESQKKE